MFYNIEVIDYYYQDSVQIKLLSLIVLATWEPRYVVTANLLASTYLLAHLANIEQN